MGLNGRREKLILQAVTVMWSAGTGGEVRRPGHLFWCALQRSCPTSAWAATELPCHHAPSWKCPGTCCWRFWKPATYASGKMSQEKAVLFIAKFPNTYSDLVWPLIHLLGVVWEKNHTSDALRWGTIVALEAPLPNPRCHGNWFMELPLTPLLQREAEQFCSSRVYCMLKGSSRAQAGSCTLIYQAWARQGLAAPTLGIQIPTGQGANSPSSANEADRQHQQNTSKPVRHVSCSACCRIPVSFQLFLSTFKLTLCKCIHFSHCRATHVPLALSRCLDSCFCVPRTERGTSSWPRKSSFCQQQGKQ